MAAKSECLGRKTCMAESSKLSEPMALEPLVMATCKACRRTLPLSDMAKNGIYRSGMQRHRHYCIPCYHLRFMKQAWENYGGKIEAYLAVHGPSKLKYIASGIGIGCQTIRIACAFAVAADLLDVTLTGGRGSAKIISLKTMREELKKL
jgi:hypothetical protein